METNDTRLYRQENKTSSELTPYVKGVVSPIVSVEDALSMWQSYETLKSKIATSSDIQEIQGKPFLKKSFWRKMSKFFGLSLELLNEKFDENRDGGTWFVVYRAVARTGDYMDGDGACSITEKGRALTSHDARATAHTRSKNRAISDLIGGGEVSAEEVLYDNEIHENKENHSNFNQSKAKSQKLVTEPQVARLYKIAETKKWTSEEVMALIRKEYNKKYPKELYMDQYDKIVSIIQDSTQKDTSADVPF